MKPPPFDYVRAESIDHAVAVLHEHGDEVKVLAGGQSLIPLLNLRLAVPSIILDVGPLSDLATAKGDDSVVTVGALVRHHDLETSTVRGAAGDLFRLAGRWIGHLPIRLRGTVGGSLAHADPTAEWCSVMHVLDARVGLRNADGRRSVPISEFFQGFLTTAVEPTDLLEVVEVPLPGSTARAGFSEYSRRSGDFALALAAALIDTDGESVTGARITIGGGGDRPVRAERAEQRLLGAPVVDPSAVAEAAQLASESIECPDTDVISGVGRRRLIRSCVARALRQAMSSTTMEMAA